MNYLGATKKSRNVFHKPAQSVKAKAAIQCCNAKEKYAKYEKHVFTILAKYGGRWKLTSKMEYGLRADTEERG